MRIRSFLRSTVIVLALAAGALWLGNQSSIGFETEGARPLLLAHRGLHQTYQLDGVQNDTCTASRIRTPTHAFLENTLPSIEQAFALGAHRVEFDIQPTADGEFVLFHDWTIDCRTEGRGVTREQTLAHLKQLDIGHGYTADGGRTFPFRGQGQGPMPTLLEALARFPQGRFLVHVKSRDPEEGRRLAAYLRRQPIVDPRRLVFYGGDEPLAALKAAMPEARVASRGMLLQCLKRYAALGWTGHVPEACKGGIVLVPSNIAPWLWGWPHRLVDRLAANGSELHVLGRYTGGDFSSGIDDVAALGALPIGYRGGLWTNRIEILAPSLK